MHLLGLQEIVEPQSHPGLDLPDSTNWTINLVPPIASEHSANPFASKPFLRVPEGYGTRLVEPRNLFSIESDLQRIQPRRFGDQQCHHQRRHPVGQHGTDLHGLQRCAHEPLRGPVHQRLNGG